MFLRPNWSREKIEHVKTQTAHTLQPVWHYKSFLSREYVGCSTETYLVSKKQEITQQQIESPKPINMVGDWKAEEITKI